MKAAVHNALPSTALTIIVALLAAIPPTIVAAASFFQARKNSEQTDQLVVKTEEVAKTAESVHILVNSSMSLQLRISAIALRRVADLTKNVKDAAAAAEAERLYAAHEEKQKLVDAKAGEPAAPVPLRTP